MKETGFILIFGIIVYLAFATVFGDASLIGSYGSYFALLNHKYFGYISYIYLFVLIIPLYVFYKDTTLNLRKFEISISSFLLLFSFLLIQSMLIDGKYRGAFAGNFVDYLTPYIGLFGLWIFWFVITLVSIMIILEKNVHEVLECFVQLIKDKKLLINKNKLETKTQYEPLEDVKEEVESTNTQKSVKEQEEEISEENVEHKIRLIKKDEQKQKQKNEIKEEEPLEKPNNIVELATKIKEHKNALVVDELEENAKLLETIEKGKTEKPKNFKLPKIEFLQKPQAQTKAIDETELDEKIQYLIEKLAHFKIEGDVVRTYAGPVVSTFEFKPAANVKVSKILNLQDDLAMALSAETIRIQAPIPGKDVVGIEIPNETVETIYLREILDDKLFKESKSSLTIALGKDIVGKPFVTDLKKLPHLLIAGTTGSGKSVGINAMILSLLYKNSPDQLRLLMIDPKMLEFSTYNDIPHLLTPVITKPKQAIISLNNMVNEMERRYELMADTRTKNIENYNEKIKKTGGESFPYIVVVIDELADLMMTSGKDVEISIARLAQKSRACGIHLIVATQRPSVDVVTGLIKANLPSRISYRVGQKVDSKIILDQMGAESLLGRGDMLFTPPGSPALVRLHAPWATEDEIEEIVEFIKAQREPNYDKSFLIEEEEDGSGSSSDSYEELDELFEDAKRVVLNDRKTSISYLQRKLQVGYNRSARIIEQLEGEGVLSAPNARGVREIL